MALLFAGAILITVIETALSYSDLVARLDRRADTLQNLIISEVLVHNQDATSHILADANRDIPDQFVEWILPEESGGKTFEPGIEWKFPGTWTFIRPLKRLGEQDFGTFVFTGNFFISGGLVHNLTHRMAFTVAICLVIAFLLLPIARRAPRELILGPVDHLMSLFRNDSVMQVASGPAYAEMKMIQDDFVSLMKDRKNLEAQRIETAQLKSVTRTAQMLAHDIRRPFSLLKATLDGLAMTTSPEAVHELVSATVPGVRKSLEHLDGIISELIAVDSPAAIEKSVFSLNDAVLRGISIAAPYADTSSRIALQLLSEVRIRGVQNQIERIVTNIVSNGLQAMGPSDQITVRLEAIESTERAVLTISNTGTYISAADAESIFLPFFSKGKPDGTGLGLAICRRIVEAHGGTIDVQSEQGIGTRFHVGLPIVLSTVEESSP